MSKTVTRVDLVSAITDEYRISQADAAEIVEDILDEINVALMRGEDVKLSGFGSFKVRSKRERMGRNPKTGESAVVTARKVVTFRPSAQLRNAVNNH